MINLEPALGNRDWRGASADAPVLPIASASEQITVRPPMHQIGRTGNPHFRSAKRHIAQRTVQGYVLAIDPLGQQYNVLILRAKDNAVPIERFEIGCRSERRRRPMTRYRNVCDIVAPVKKNDSGVFE